MHFVTLLLLSTLISVVSGHARIKIPKPLNAPVEDSTGNAYNAPLNPDGSEFPCKGLHKKAGVDKTPTQKWQAGAMAAFEILGHGSSTSEGALAAHSGGSCQASLSFDDGVTWKAVHSFQGGCPKGCTLGSNMAGANQTFPFMIPAGTKNGPCLFAWTWTAVSGNRDEYYMNCASVEITGSGTSTLDDYPNMYVGDMSIPGQIATGQCRSTAGNALQYPNPGPSSQVTQTTVAGIPFKKPSDGQCFAPGSKSSGTSSSVASLEPSTAVAPSRVSSSAYATVGTTSNPVVKSSSNPVVKSSSYPVVQPSSYGISTNYQVSESASISPADATSLSRFPTTNQVMNPTSYPLVQPTSYSSDDGTESMNYPSPTGQSSSYSFTDGRTGGASHSRSHTRGGHRSSSASDFPAQASSSYPISYPMTTMLTYTTSAVTPAMYSPTPQTSVYNAQKVSSSGNQSPPTPTYRYV